MSSITIPVKTSEHPHLRPLNVLRDLSAVADLIELCFSPTMDAEGQRYLADMRRASREDSFSNWASRLNETASLPMMGYVWDEGGKIIGNASLIPFRDNGKRIYLIANVATHPDHRRRGIGRALTERVMKQARDKKASAIWLHVRDDNPGAIKLYQDLGFQEIARRTTWTAVPDSFYPQPASDIQIVSRYSHFWSRQQQWLRRSYPDFIDWYQPLNLNALRPGFMNWLYLLFVDFNITQWAAVHGSELLATLSWMPHGGRTDFMYAAVPPSGLDARLTEGAPKALTQLLIHARRTLSSRAALSLDFPAGEMTEAITAAGFRLRRTLLWMKA
ncbi:MAG: GNAT family N-acetyltransferase [Anaerolineales bacterium]